MNSGLSDSIDILIVNYKTAALTVQAARRLSGPNRHVFVCDNSSDIRAEDLPEDVVLYSPGTNIGYARGNNALFSQGEAPLVLLLNADAVCSPATLYRLSRHLEADTSAWGAVPLLLNSDGTVQDYYRRLPTLGSIAMDRLPVLRGILRRSWAAHTYGGGRIEAFGSIEAPAGACLVLRRAAIGESLFNERYPIFFNDTDLARRLNEKGYCALVQSATVMHLKGASLAEERAQSRFAISRMYDRDALRYARDHLTGWPILLPLVMGRRVAEMASRLGSYVWIRRPVSRRSSPSGPK